MKPIVYVETSVPSTYFDTRTTYPMSVWRMLTREWWNDHAGAYELVTSNFVMIELADAPREKALQATALLSTVRRVETTHRTQEVIDYYIRHKLMPKNARGDAAHLASASIHEAAFLLTWNCKHLANGNKFEHIATLNRRLGLTVPMIVTPMTLLSERKL